MAGNADFLFLVNTDVVKTDEIEKIKMSTTVVENDSPIRPIEDEAMEPMETAHEHDELPEDPLNKMESVKSLKNGNNPVTTVDTVLGESESNIAASDTVANDKVINPEHGDQIIVTSAMIEEEARLKDEGEKKEREIMEKHEQIWKEMSQDEQAEKYRKLQYLLTKSNMYTEYLIDRMKQQKESKKAREEKRLKRLANKKAQEEKQKEESKKNEETKTENKIEKVEEIKKEVVESPKLQRRTRGRKTDSDFEYSQESTSRRSGRNQKDTPVGSPMPSSQTSGKRKTRNGTLDSFLVSSQESNSTQSDTPVHTSRKRKKFEEEENDAPIDMETFSQSSLTSVMSTSSTRSKRGKKSRLDEMTEIAAENTPLSSPKSVKSQILSPSSQKNIKSSALDTPKSTSSVKLRNSPRISNGQADIQNEEISSPKSSSSVKFRNSPRISNGQADVQNEEISSPKSSSSVKFRNSPRISNGQADIQNVEISSPKSSSSVKFRNSPHISNGQADVQNEEISSPKPTSKSNSSSPRSQGNDTSQDSKVKDTNSGDKPSETIETNNADDKAKEENVDKENEKRIINGEEVLDNQPVLFTGGVLRQYQIDGFNWLEVLYENGINGILADEMGLGKTVQCVAIISHLVNMGIVGPFLVVGPLSTLPNWFSEFKRFTPKVPVILYHGTKEERAGMRSKMRKKVIIREGVAVRPVVITSYEIAMLDSVFMSKQEWKYMIVDEGHRIKNSQCRLIKQLRTYDSTHRLLLTGTPLQNNLAELWSLLNFLLPEIFDDLGSFESWFDIQNISDEAANEKIIAEEKENNILSMLHQILRPFMLRRLKTDVDLLIPPKKEILVYAPMTAEQQEMYRQTVDKTILQKIEEKNSEKEVIEYNEAGRPKRKSAGKVNYQLMFEDQIESDLLDGKKHRKQAKTREKDEEELEAWVAAIGEMYDERHKGKTVKAKKSQVTVRLQNIMMQLRKCCNHPYLLEHPIDQETGDLKLDECIINKSGKMMVLDKMLAELKKRGHKVLVFSQMTKMMDLLEDFCVIRDYNYCRLDGTSKMQERKEQMESFNDPDGDKFVFLLSTRAGGLGINLTGADTCIIYDSDWNPQCDLQAQDRCHRIGQTKPVVVYRFITVNTIDQRIVERAAAKRKLEKMVIHKGKFKKGITEESSVEMKPMNPEELLSLLESTDHCSIMSGKEGSSIGEEDLNQLLDRSDLYEKWDQQKEIAEGLKPKKKKTKKQEEDKREGKCFKVIEQGDEESRSSLEPETKASCS